MPSWFPEGDVAKPGDDEKRSLAKMCNLLLIKNGNKGPWYFNEGSVPLPGDSEERLLQKINALKGG